MWPRASAPSDGVGSTPQIQRRAAVGTRQRRVLASRMTWGLWSDGIQRVGLSPVREQRLPSQRRLTYSPGREQNACHCQRRYRSAHLPLADYIIGRSFRFLQHIFSPPVFAACSLDGTGLAATSARWNAPGPILWPRIRPEPANRRDRWLPHRRSPRCSSAGFPRRNRTGSAAWAELRSDL